MPQQFQPALRTSTRPAATVLLLTWLLVPAPVDAQATHHAGPQAIARVDSVFASWSSDTSPGCAVAVARAGTPVLERAYGMAELEHGISNTPEAIFEAGSVSKQFTAAAVLLLAEEGRLSLDDDVRAHVPELPEYDAPITIRHLLHHTSGLRDWGSVAAISGWGRSARTHTHAHVLDIVSRQSALNYPPGEAYSYTNSGYNLLAVIVDRVSGVPFARFSQERIFGPLGMTNTQWRDDFTRIVPGRATAYSPRGDGYAINQPIENVHGNGGLLTTVADLLRWDEALHAGKLGGPEFAREMQRRGRLNDGREIGYAAGLQIGSRRGVPTVSHTGATSGYRAYLGRYPEQQLTVALLCNVSDANPGALGGQVADVFLTDLPEPQPTAAFEEIELPREALRTREGLYRDARTGEPVRLVLEADGLRLEGGPRLVPITEEEFAVGSGARSITFLAGAGAAFDDAVDGVVTGRFERVGEFEPTPSELAAYAGTYYSPDAETRLRVAVEEGRLVLHRRPDARMPLTPVYEDAFRGPGGLYRFHRDATGAISELGLRQARVHDLRFARVDERDEGG